MRTVKVALAGAWHVHTQMYIFQIKELFGDNIEWAYVWDDDNERARKFAAMLDCAVARDYQTILDDASVEAVLCEAETNKHKDILIAAANAGKHCYTDKILAPSTADALEIKRAVEAAGVKFAVSHESLPVASYQYAKKLLSSGKLGDLVAIHFRRAHGMAKRDRLPENWFSRETAGGGALIDLGIHGLSMIAFFGGEIKSVSAYIHNFTGHETEDSATVMVEYASGAIATAHTDMVTSIMENNFEILGTNGIICVQGMEGRESVAVNSKHIPGMEERMTEVPSEEYSARAMFPISQFLELIGEDSPEKTMPGLDFDTALKVVRLVEAAYESAATGKAVAF